MREDYAQCLQAGNSAGRVLQMFPFTNHPHLPALCRRYCVQRLAAFGSVLTAAFNDDSDVDLIVTFEPMPLEDYADNYLSLKDALESLFHRPVDLLEAQAIRNPYLKAELDATQQLVYGN